MRRRPPGSTLLPYTTLFRSSNEPYAAEWYFLPEGLPCRWPRLHPKEARGCCCAMTPTASRSEEHTSELQSHVNLVCRLLLEKKKHEPAALAGFASDDRRRAL